MEVRVPTYTIRHFYEHKHVFHGFPFYRALVYPNDHTLVESQKSNTMPKALI